MIMEPIYTLNTFKYMANRNMESKEGYQRYEIDYKNKVLVPFKGDKLEAKSAVVAPLFNRILSGKTVIDLGCDKGYFSWLACRAGATRVVAVDIRRQLESFVSILAKTMRWPIEALNYDLFRGTANFVNKFDYALALAMIHQVEADPKYIVERIRSLVSQGAIIEFCEDYSEVKGPEWTLANFEAMTKSSFREIEFLDKYEAVGQWKGLRYIYHCKC